MLAPDKNRGVTCQTDGNHISKPIGYLVGVVELLLRVLTNNHLKYIKLDIEKSLNMLYV
jgi:hypothetical protein